MKRISAIIVFLMMISPAFGYNYDSAQRKANKLLIGAFRFPLETVQEPICGFFGYRAPNGNWHGGNDYAVPQGTPVQAAKDGVISRVVDGWSNTYPYQYVYGNVVYINHRDQSQTRYGHLLSGSIPVKVGQVVYCGDLIGQVNNSGYSSGDHLHFEIRSGVDTHSGGTPVDPYPWLYSRHNGRIQTASEYSFSRQLKRSLKDIKRETVGIFPEKLEVNIFQPNEFGINNCNIPNKAEGVSCLPAIRFKFNQPVDLDQVIQSFWIEPAPLVPYWLTNHLTDNQKVVEIQGFLLETNTRYSIGLKNLTSLLSDQTLDWQISFRTGNWPHPPKPSPTEPVIIIQSGVKHYGNHIYATEINKGFVSHEHLHIFSTTFQLKTLPISARLKMKVRGAECYNPITINLNLVGRLVNNMENNGQEQVFPIPIHYLRLGENKLMIEVLGNTTDLYDDFELTDIQLEFQY